MYDMREALAYSGHLPAQQQQGITPELLDLLAMQKVDADKKAAAQAMALSSGQTPPTVAEGLKQTAMQSARQEIAQKMGLGGLMQKMQAQQGPTMGAPSAPGAPAGPAQAAPPQGMAAGGLAYIPSNLPKGYANGGIIAFDDGGQAEDPANFQDLTDLSQFQPAPGDTINDKERKAALFQQYVKAQAAANAQRNTAADAGTGRLASMWGGIKDALGMRPDNNNYGNEGRGMGVAPKPAAQSVAAAPAPNGPTGSADAAPTPAAPMQSDQSPDEAQAGRLQVLNQELRDAMQRVQANPSDASSAQDVASLQREIARVQSNPSKPTRYPGQTPGGLQAIAAQSVESGPGATPQPTPGVATFAPPGIANNGAPSGNPLQDAMQKSILGTLGKSRDDVTNEQEAMYNKYMAPGLAGILANKQAALEELKALQAKQAAARPSDFLRALQLMGQNVHSRTPGLGGAFENVSTGMDATHQGYISQDMQSAQNRQALLNDIAQAQQTNDIGRYTGAIAALKEHDASVNAAQGAGKSILDTQTQAQNRLDVQREKSQNRLDGASEKAAANADAAFSRDPRAKTLQKQIDARLQPGYLAMNPSEPSLESLKDELNQIHNQYYVQHGVPIVAPIVSNKAGWSAKIVASK